MKKFLISVALIASTLLPLAAHAVDIEVGAGLVHYQPRGNMMWYQEGMPYKLDLNAPSIEAGLAGAVITHDRWGLDWHASYVYMGTVSSDAIATSDENYNKVLKSCDGPCHYKSRFVGHGNVHGIKLSLEPNFTRNGIRYGVEFGAYIFKPKWEVTLYNRPMENGYEGTGAVTVSHNRKIQVAPVVGASVGYKNFSVSYLYYFNRSTGDEWHSLWKGTTTLMIKYRF